MKTRQTRTFIMYGLMIALLVTSIAYATLQTALNITGTVNRQGGSWNIYFTNLSEPTLVGSGTSDSNGTSLQATTFTFSTGLEAPGDSVAYNFDVKNDGSMDAVISTIVLGGVDEAKAEDITYTFTYKDGTPLAQNDTLASGETKNLKVVVSYDDVDTISETTTRLDLSATIIYVQKETTSGGSSSGTTGGGTIVADTSGAASPNLLNNSLTPVVYDETANSGTGSWVIADTTQPWYNYGNQQWANAVILNSGVSTTAGTPIDVETQTKAMYVWIPRYEYKIDGTYGKGGTSAELPGEIEVNFISTSQTSASSGYILHPAFQWDNDDNGSISASENIAGIWVGKFETTGSGDTPTILPNQKSLVDQNVYTQFTTAQKFGTYLSNSSNTDSHMMKNNEWGAVAYLSQSSYGKYGNSNYTGANKEVYKNNSSYIYTGRSGGTPSASSSSAGTCEYNSITDRGSGTGSCGSGASTTGNIYGVYDMSGGAEEYVMGYLTTANSNYKTDPDGYFGLSDDIFENYAGFTSKPADKYFDAYTTTTNTTACNGGICYGHALSETSGWYSDYAHFVGPSDPWFPRGGNCYDTTDAGVFGSNWSTGDANVYISFRSVVLATGA